MSDNELPAWKYSCPCGYSLRSAYGFLNQQEIHKMLRNHIESVHIDNVEK